MLEILASFTGPMEISNGPAWFGWLAPLVAVIALVYKAIKMPEPFPVYKYIRDVVILFFTIIIFMAVIAVALYAIMWLITARA
jgi:hypothetical protein